MKDHRQHQPIHHAGPKEHLGENVYADCDGHSLVLTHECGRSSSTICLTPRMYRAFVQFAKRFMLKEKPLNTARRVVSLLCDDDDDDDWGDDDYDDDDDWDDDE